MNWLIDPQQADLLSRHVLREITDPASPVRAFYLEEPGQGRNLSALLVFTPEGICIQGDLTPSTNGDVSRDKKGIGWFAGTLAPEYLCEKFLPLAWYPEAAARELKAWIAEIEGSPSPSPKDEERIILLRECLEDIGEMDSGRLQDALEELDCGDSSIGYDYPIRAQWLVAIQRRFAELWTLREETP